MVSRRIATLAVSVGLVGGSVAAPAAIAHNAKKASADKVTMSEFKFVLSTKTVKKGTVTFTVKNAGKLPHDFAIDGKKTPLVSPGKTAKLTVKFTKAGKFPYMCTVPGHAAAGMKGTLVVK